VVFLALSYSNQGHAEFDSSPENRKSLIRDHQFGNLKQDVFSYLVNSWCSEEKASMIMDLIFLEKPKTCVEIGVFTGSSFLPIAVTLKHLGQGMVYAIDPWSNQESVKHLSNDDPNKSWWQTVDMQSVKHIFSQMLKKWSIGSFCKVIAEPSSHAVDQIKEIDFLHLDGNYSEASSMEDVQLFFPKVKIGGYILISNVQLVVNGIHPKMESFFYLFDGCQMIAELENGNAYLLQKINEISY